MCACVDLVKFVQIAQNFGVGKREWCACVCLGTFVSVWDYHLNPGLLLVMDYIPSSSGYHQSISQGIFARKPNIVVCPLGHCSLL